MSELPRVGEKLLTVEQVAERLGMSTVWVYQHSSGERRPQIPYIKLGRSVRYRASSVEDFVRALEQVA
jgi:predicted DNA-binding transcriptional regulator AlpA